MIEKNFCSKQAMNYFENLVSKGTPTISHNKVNKKSTLFTSLKSFTLCDWVQPVIKWLKL